MNDLSVKRQHFWESKKRHLLEQLNDAVLETAAKMKRQKQWHYCNSPIIREFHRDNKQLIEQLKKMQLEELLEYAFLEALSSKHQ